MRAALPTRLVPLVLAAALGGLLTGCGPSNTPVESNRVGAQPVQGQVVRTPAPLGTDVLTTNPPLVQKLPGATGEAPGTPVPGKVSGGPGQGSDGDHAAN